MASQEGHEGYMLYDYDGFTERGFDKRLQQSGCGEEDVRYPARYAICAGDSSQVEDGEGQTSATGGSFLPAGRDT